MNVIYKKTLKGVEEIALRSKNLQMRLRFYLLLVDGVKSVDLIQELNPALPEVEMILSALYDEGYLQIVGDVKSNTSNSITSNPDISQLNTTQPQVNPVDHQAANAVLSPSISKNIVENDLKFKQARETMVREIMVLLGKDAEMVVGKIQRCETSMDLFAMMMGLKKIITMYANADKADIFVNKFSYVSTL